MTITGAHDCVMADEDEFNNAHIASHNKDRSGASAQPRRPDKHGANKLDHYRYRKETHLYNVLLNLPQEAELGASEAPPVAVDSAQPGWTFFIARGGKFRRQVRVFHANSGVPGPFVTFVFGFLAKATRFGSQVDVRRRGRVPKGVLRKPVR